MIAGECGACTAHIDGHRAVFACMSLAVMQKGRSITTIEGVANSSTLHPLQAAFIEHDGFQCGFWHVWQTASGLMPFEGGLLWLALALRPLMSR